MDQTNLTMFIDFYEFTMANAYFEQGLKDKIVYFELFFRDIPDKGGYALMAGLESVVKYLENLKFSEDDLKYLRSKSLFSEGFLNYLKNFKFSGDLYSVKEGTAIFPNEPIMIVKAPIIEAQLIETFLLMSVNHQSLLATKASRLKEAAKNRLLIEMGARRAHGVSSANYGARAAYIGGVDLTSNTYADRHFNIPASGTMAHSFIQIFPTELEAFQAYANTYPHNTTFLLDTYNTLKSGVPNAIKVIKEVLIPKGVKKYAVRIDSGDLTYLAKKTREMLDEAGLKNCKIIASNALDEYIIKALLDQGAPIDSFGVGERLITAKSDPIFGAVYKLVAVEENHLIIPKMKLSDNPAKITTPHFKKLYRVHDLSTDKINADLLTVHDEIIDPSKPLTLFNPDFTWQTTTYTEYRLEPLHDLIMKAGKLIITLPNIETIRAHALKERENLWEEMKRFEYPHQYYVDLSQKLWDIKMSLINEYKETLKKGNE